MVQISPGTNKSKTILAGYRSGILLGGIFDGTGRPHFIFYYIVTVTYNTISSLAFAPHLSKGCNQKIGALFLYKI